MRFRCSECGHALDSDSESMHCARGHIATPMDVVGLYTHWRCRRCGRIWESGPSEYWGIHACPGCLDEQVPVIAECEPMGEAVEA